MNDLAALPIISQLNALTRTVNTSFRNELLTHRLSPEQVILILALLDLGKASQRQVSEYLYIEKSTFSRNIEKLIQQKLVRRVKGNDKRTKEISLTKRGLNLAKELQPISLAFNRTLLRKIGFAAANEISAMLLMLKNESN